MKPLLKFTDPDLERRFTRHYDKQVAPSMKKGLWLAVSLYAVFSLLDYYMMPLSYRKIWAIRFIVVIPSSILIYFISYIRIFRRYMQAAWAMIGLIMGLGIVAMIAIAIEGEPGFKYYYAGLMLVIMGICSLFRLRFYYALATCICIICGYEITAVFIQKITTRGIHGLDFPVFLNNNFFFISSNILSIVATYYIEQSARIRFRQEEVIKEKQRDISRLLKNIHAELELASQVQLRLLPSCCPYMPGIRISHLYKPMEEVGGDFYDFITFEEKNLVGLFISDVTGHGMPAALITSMLKTLARTAGNLRMSTSEFMNYLNNHLTGQIGLNFITALYAIYDSGSGIFRFSRAGHPWPVLIHNGEITQLKCTGGVIGLDSFMKFGDVSIRLEPGDKVFLYTDGLTEQTNAAKEFFQDTFFSRVLPSLSHMAIEDIISVSYRRLIEFSGSEKFDDDVCMVGFEVL